MQFQSGGPPTPPPPPAAQSAPTTLVAAIEPATSSREDFNDSWIVVPIVLTMIFVLFPLMLVKARRIWKSTPTRVAPADDTRLERIEQAVEAIAIEVERVSEGQRFVTKLLSDTSRTPASLPNNR